MPRLHTLAELVATAEAELAAVKLHNLAFLTSTGEIIRETAQHLIMSETGAGIPPIWPPLAKSTIARKRYARYPFPEKILYATGNLYHRIGYIVAGSTVTIGSEEEYAKYLEEGTSKMSPRPLWRKSTAVAMRKIVKLLPGLYLSNFK